MMPVVKGSMMVLNQLSNLETTVGRFYINLLNRMIDLARFSLPYADPMGDGECPGPTFSVQFLFVFGPVVPSLTPLLVFYPSIFACSG